jgi:N6-adenosine-specific RNA methylase IME4|tara:strand:- start:229 stop:420 length:192 start_codon:yes stop_codon:yes gene_type:complete
MTDNELENIHTVDVKVTAESMDAHVQCLRDNGYSVTKKITFTKISFWLMIYTLGLFTMAVYLK